MPWKLPPPLKTPLSQPSSEIWSNRQILQIPSSSSIYIFYIIPVFSHISASLFSCVQSWCYISHQAFLAPTHLPLLHKVQVRPVLEYYCHVWGGGFVYLSFSSWLGSTQVHPPDQWPYLNIQPAVASPSSGSLPQCSFPNAVTSSAFAPSADTCLNFVGQPRSQVSHRSCDTLFSSEFPSSGIPSVYLISNP